MDAFNQFVYIAGALTTVVCIVLCLVLFGPGRFLIPAMLLITLVLTVLRGREEGKE